MAPEKLLLPAGCCVSLDSILAGFRYSASLNNNKGGCSVIASRLNWTNEGRIIILSGAIRFFFFWVTKIRLFFPRLTITHVFFFFFLLILWYKEFPAAGRNDDDSRNSAGCFVFFFLVVCFQFASGYQPPVSHFVRSATYTPVIFFSWRHSRSLTAPLK